MQKMDSVCVYCGTGAQVDPAYKEAARALGELLAKRGLRLVYGGGKVGLMGIVSAACLAAGGAVTGIIPGHILEKEVKNTDVSELLVVDSMHTRKRLMVERASAFVVLPGGFGTLDETFEILTWKYLGLHDKPVVIVNINGFYEPLMKMVDSMVASGFTPAWHRKLYTVVDAVEKIPDVLAGQEGHIRPDVAHM